MGLAWGSGVGPTGGFEVVGRSLLSTHGRAGYDHPPMGLPRVRPKMPMEDLVSRDAHPPRAKIATVPDEDDGTEAQDFAFKAFHWTTQASLVALVVFWVALPLAGLLGPLLGLWAGLAFLGLAASSFVVFYVMGAE